MSFRFVHIADVHLDTPFQNRDAYIREVLGNCLKSAFSSAIDLAIERDAHALLIAGDLFDDENLSYSTVKFLSGEIDRLRENGTRVFYASGNHDPSIRGTKSPAIKWADNVHIFSSAEPEVVPVLDEHGQVLAYVAGAGHERRAEERNLAREFPQGKEDIPYIGLLHCLMVDGESADAHERYAPCSRWDLEEKGYAYWALGHIHRKIEYTGNTHIVYPGNISGRSFREVGPKGAYYVEIGRGGTVDTEFVPLSKALWIDIDVEVMEDVDDWMSLESSIRGQLAQRLDSELALAGNIETVMARLNLKGRSSMYNSLKSEEDIEMLEQDIGADLGIECLKIDTDSVYPPIDIENFREGPHLASYVLSLLEMAKDDEELLLSLKPEPIAGRSVRQQGREETLEYLKQLLDDMEYEALSRLIEEGDL